MKQKYMAYYFSILLIISTQACKKSVEIAPPISQLVTTSVFNNNTAATAAVLSIYAQMYNVPWNLHRVTALSSDELKNYATDATSMDLYVNSLSAQTDGSALNIWSPVYYYLYQANAVLEGLGSTNGVSENVKKQLRGEALFIRAYWYFYLVNLYGDVPLITTTDHKVNSVMSRTAKAQVYAQIIGDLKNAESFLSNNYLNATDTATTVDRIRPTTWAADALLARTYLYTNKYDSSEMYANKLINNSSMFSLTTDLNKTFLANSTEAIWQITPQSSAYYTPEGAFFSLIAPPATSLNNSTSISSQLLNAFEPNDQRKINWIKSYTNGANTWFYPYKYKDNTTATTLKEYTMMLRLAEQYLIRAEARAHENNLTGAIDDVNIIRTRAGLTLLSYSLSLDQVLSAIAHERQVELFTEGDRWLDLKRTGSIDNIMNSITPQKGGSWNTNQKLYPIPVTDIQNDYNLMQNPGY